MLTIELVERVLASLPGKTVGVLGDLFLDRYLDIDAARNEPSVETGLTAYQVVRVRAYPGAAGTVINNLAALGVGRIVPIAAIGDDGEGYELRQALRELPAVDPAGLFAAPGRRTPTYTKPMLAEPGHPPRELNRLDIKNRTPTPPATQDAILRLLDEAWPRLDALIVLDQVSEPDCGVVTERVRDRLAELGARDPGKFVLADSRERVGLFRNVCVKPNADELGKSIDHENRALPWAPTILLDSAFVARRTTFYTCGEQGISVIHPLPSAKPVDDWFKVITQVPAYPVAGPIDICGAGDSCSAGIVSAVVSGATFEQAAAFGNLVASITIQQIGVTGTATPDQVRRRWREVEAGPGGPA